MSDSNAVCSALETPGQSVPNQSFSKTSQKGQLATPTSEQLSGYNSLSDLIYPGQEELSTSLPELGEGEGRALDLEHPRSIAAVLKAPSPSQHAGSKHSLSGSDRSSIKQDRRKRPRLSANIKLPGTFNFADPQDQLGPLSPLFFSNSDSPRPALPPRFSSSEAAARMLSRAKGEDNIRTVTMPRGSYSGPSGPSAPTSSPQAQYRSRRERPTSSRTQSSEPPETPEQKHLLHQIGIAELLEQDNRPIFIVDLADVPHPETADIPVIFANQSLISCGSLLDAIQGRKDDVGSSSPLTPRSGQAFRDWIYASHVNGTIFGGSATTFVQHSLSWTTSTLRNRFRVVSGTPTSDVSRRPSTFSSTLTTTSELQTIRTSVEQPVDDSISTQKGPTSTRDSKEIQDYFGGAVGRLIDASSHRQAAASHLVRASLSPGLVVSPLGEVGTAYSKGSSPGFSAAVPTQLDLEKVPSIETASHLGSYHSISDSVGFFDWTRLPNDENLPEHVRFARSIDWGSTSLGPIDTWNADLRQMVNLIMASPHPAAMYWGPDLVAIYNEAYVMLAGQKHPSLMGMKYSEAWQEIWEDIKEIFETAMETGQATMKDDDCLFIKRSDFLEETYFSWSIIPMVGSDGSVMGLYNPAFEKTRRKVAERRMLTLREVGERTASARDVRAFWRAALEALECNEYDTPFALLYSLADDEDSDDTSATGSSVSGGMRLCYLEGALGAPTGHAAAPESMDLKTSDEGFTPMFRDAMLKRQSMVLEPAQEPKLASLLEGLEWRGFGDPAQQILICPVTPTTSENTLGFMVLGVNPRRPFDDDYALFIQLLSRQLATSLASVVLFEEEIRRGQRAAKMAALDRIELSEQLAIRTQEAIDSETRFTRMAEFAPVGMFIANSEGQVTFCNDTWYDITRVPRSLHFAENWVDYVLDADVQLVTRLWGDLVEGRKAVSAEFRFRAPWIDKSGTEGETWVLFSAYPERHDDGTLKSVFGSITNISSQKWAEGLQKKKMEEAVELKRQQENFIDITSHEMRNPLSAILQCADEIVTSLVEGKASAKATFDTTIYDTNIDAAQTIALCAQHQKRIVDDVLTMSKIDSALLMVTPVDSQPLMVVQRALKMFEGELASADIDMSFHVDSSFQTLGIDWVRFDPSRVMQVLINLTTNAIKFTTTESRRTIMVKLAASLQLPSAKNGTEVKYVPKRANRTDMTQGKEWGEGEEVYIHFSISDTGRGLTTEETKSLFMRFSQASPRTHVQYGGSGLGLFISRELTELQGGEIGVASQPGEGSTFAFFVKARKCPTPVKDLQHMPPAHGSRRAPAEKAIPRTGSMPKVRDFGITEDQAKEAFKILLVEDNLVNQRVLMKQLKKLDCEVHVANHGREAIDKLQTSCFWAGNEGKPDALDVRVVLMDQEMPVLDGIGATRQIRELERSGKIVRHVPILGITANARPEQIQQLIEAGMDDVVSKPFRITEVVPKIDELSARYRPRTDLGRA